MGGKSWMLALLCLLASPGRAAEVRPLPCAVDALVLPGGRDPQLTYPVDWQRAPLACGEGRSLHSTFFPPTFYVHRRVLPVFRGFEDERYQRHDFLIERYVAELNQHPEDWCGCTETQAAYMPGLSPALVKAWIIQESGGGDGRSLAAWESDPAQVNVPGDWCPHKTELGLRLPASRNQGQARDNLMAALRMLARKGFGRSGQAPLRRQEAEFDGWRAALERYNGRGEECVNGRKYRENYAERIFARATIQDRHQPIQLPPRR
ncbi:MAG: hypothetical protein L6R48_00645 [Planctomycetes bacterium]|nr:hypothetical protein [Planctomycetota bacterium]